MSETSFLILNAAVVTLVVLSILVLRRSPKGPTKLELRDESRIASDAARDVKVVPNKPEPKFRDPRVGAKGARPVGWDNYQPRIRKPQVEILDAEERSLNALFQWNGHTWDAFEVLGLPAGSSVESVRVAFQRAAALADQETLPFLKAALETIAQTQKREPHG